MGIDQQNIINKDMDYISIHIPLTSKSKNLIDMKVLKTMKKNSIIINTSRGGIVNEIVGRSNEQAPL